MDEYFAELIKEIKLKKLTKDKISSLKNKLAAKYGLKKPPTNIEVLLNAELKDIPQLKKYLLTKPTRTISGVAVVAVMTAPKKCPHGKCIFCPGGPASAFGNVPQSYTGREPATMRGMRNSYDPYLQVFNRLEQYIVLGHVPEKVELIIMGGTFPSFSKKYQEDFVAYCFKALNDFSKLFFKQQNSTHLLMSGLHTGILCAQKPLSGILSVKNINRVMPPVFDRWFLTNNELDLIRFKEFFELPGDIFNKKRIEKIHKKILFFKNLDLNEKIINELIKNDFNIKLKNKSIDKKINLKKKKVDLKKEQLINEKIKIKCVGLTIETRPDYGKLKQGNEMLRLGCTRVEVGVQSVYNDVLRFIERGHSVQQSVDSIRVLKDLGFKINAHYMPGLIENRGRDLNGMKQLFENPDFRPDMLKIYPCMVLKGTKLFDLYKMGRFKPITTNQAASLIADFKKFVPEYCRIMRVQRDIPPKVAEAGVNRSNLRQYIVNLIKTRNIKCKCIRCREAGHVLKNKKIKQFKIKIIIRHYAASKGNEFFISAEDTKHDILFGFCRLRFPSSFLRKEITEDSALIRELHVYGQLAEIGKKGVVQHRGFGKILLREAEEIAGTYYKNKIVVISGIGAREYYRKLGYQQEGPYMVKYLK